MELSEITRILAYSVNASSPRHEVDQLTEKVWNDIIGDLNYEDAKQATIDYYRHNRYPIAPSEIAQRVALIQYERALTAWETESAHLDDRHRQELAQLAPNNDPTEPYAAALERIGNLDAHVLAMQHVRERANLNHRRPKRPHTEERRPTTVTRRTYA